MFKGKIFSRTNVNGKVHTFQKDFDDYESYRDFLGNHPEFQQNILDHWNTWRIWDSFLDADNSNKNFPAQTKYLPEDIDLTKYEQRRLEKKEKARENAQKRHALESSKVYLTDYIAENPDDKEAQNDLEKIQKELNILA